MLKSGKTPLVRARNLEKKLNVGEIYLKLEGQNPTGHKNDRIGEVLAKNARAHNKSKIIVDGSLTFIKSVIYFSELYDLKIIIPVFKKESWKKKKFNEKYLVNFGYLKGEDTFELIKKLSDESNAFIAIEGFTNTHISQMVLEDLVSEILEKLKYDLDTVTTQLDYGYTLTGLYNIFLKNLMNDNLSKFPKVFCGVWKYNSKIFKRYLEDTNHGYSSNILDEMSTEHIPKESFQLDKKLLTDMHEAISETNSIVTSITKEELKNVSKLLKKSEMINIDYRESYALAAFIKEVKEGIIGKGKHVIILNDAKTISNVEEYNKTMDITLEELVMMTKKWLAEYHEPTLETKEAIENALDKGYILLASINGKYEGICVIINLGFEAFFPKYHLAYIGTSDKLKGRGLGSELIQRAIDLTKGSLSLHVDLDNKGAKKMYKKYGFEHYYNRMIYKE